MSEVGEFYEIWVHARENWHLANLCEMEIEAVSQAQKLLSMPENLAVKALAISFSEASQNYRETKVFEGGSEPAVTEEPELEHYQPFCTAVEDFYCGDVFQIVGRLLKQPLRQWKITVPELMYGARHMKKLNDTGMLLQGAVQKVAISQCQGTAQKTSERILELYELTTSALGALKQAVEAGLPKITDKDLLAVVQGAAKASQPHKMLMMALSEHFFDYDSVETKYDQVFDFLAQYDQPEIIAAMDLYLAGYLANESFTVELLDAPESLGAFLVDQINLVKGNFVPRGEQAKRQELLNRLFAKDRLPESRKILLARVETELRGPKSLVQGNDFANIMFHEEISKALRQGGAGADTDPQLLDILDVRCEKILGRERIGKVIGPVAHVAGRIEKLLEMSRGVSGPNSRNRMARFFLPLLALKSNEQELIDDGKPVMTRLQALRHMQKGVEDVGFYDLHVKRITARVDEVAVAILKSGNVIPNLLEQHDTRVGKLTALLKLLGADILTHGKARDLVKAEARTIMGNDEFLTELVPSSAEKSEQMSILKNFYEMLSKAGLAA